MSLRIITLFTIVGLMVSVTNAVGRHRLKAGDIAPQFVVTDAYGNTVDVQSLRGHKVLITFNRYVSCPLCNFRMHELLEHYDSLSAKGLVFISIYESAPAELLKYTDQEAVPFKMIGDPEQKLYKTYGVQRSNWKTIKGFFHKDYRRIHGNGRKAFKNEYDRDGHLNRIGADFLIDEKGIIVTAYYGKFVGDHYPVNDIVTWVN